MYIHIYLYICIGTARSLPPRSGGRISYKQNTGGLVYISYTHTQTMHTFSRIVRL